MLKVPKEKCLNGHSGIFCFYISCFHRCSLLLGSSGDFVFENLMLSFVAEWMEHHSEITKIFLSQL